MASPSFQPCSRCAEENQAKPKLGIHPCHGCQQAFCLVHLTHHRQDLMHKLDAVIIQRDEFFAKTFDDANFVNQTTEKPFAEISDWEMKMKDAVHQLAVETREQLHSTYLARLDEIKQRYDQLTKQLAEKRESDDFFEQDVERLAAELEQLKLEVRQIRVEPPFNTSESIDHSQLLGARDQTQPSVATYLNSSSLLLERQVISLHDRNCFFLAASNTHILAYILSINRNENRLVLYHAVDGNEICSTGLDVRLGNVCDMVYAPSLERCFLVVCRFGILLYDPFKQTTTNMIDVKSVEDRPFWSITVTSNTNTAFISLDSDGYIERWSTEAHPKWTLIKRWSIADVLHNADQGVRMVRVCETKNQLAMVILQQNRYWRVDFFDFDLQLLHRGRQLMVSSDADKSSFGCRLLFLPDDVGGRYIVNERSARSLWLVDDATCQQIDKDVHSAFVTCINQRRRIVVSYSNEPRRIEIFNL